MEMSGEQLVPAPQKVVWDALNDPEMLKASVPGCESIERSGDNEYQVLMVARVGPVSAKFKGKLTLSDIKPPDSYALSFEGQGGPAGFAKGGAQVRLDTQGMTTRLAYDVKASVGGKLAQIGARPGAHVRPTAPPQHPAAQLGAEAQGRDQLQRLGDAHPHHPGLQRGGDRRSRARRRPPPLADPRGAWRPHRHSKKNHSTGQT